MSDGARARRLRAGAAAVVALVVAVLGLLAVPSTGVAAPVQDPSSTISVPLSSSTTTTLAEATTTTEAVTTTTEAVTTTTARRTTTTRAAAVAATTTTTVPETVTTAANILVPGDGTEGAESTTTTIATATKVSDGGPSDGTLIALVITGLLIIAVVVAVLTWRYWLATRPPLLDVEPEPPAAGHRPAPAR